MANADPGQAGPTAEERFVTLEKKNCHRAAMHWRGGNERRKRGKGHFLKKRKKIQKLLCDAVEMLLCHECVYGEMMIPRAIRRHVS